MKKWFITCGIVLGMMSSTAWADARSDLQSRLGKINSFSASFEQTVTGPSGAAIQQGEGKLAVTRPNLFRWEAKTPDESLLVTAGKTLWFFNPFVEQVTISNLKDATSNTPFVLLTRNNPSDWAKYNITQKGDQFTLKPIKSDGNMKQFDLTVTPAGVIKGFSVVEMDGQKSQTVLNRFSTSAVSKSQFSFTVPKGVEIDDQRN